MNGEVIRVGTFECEGEVVDGILIEAPKKSIDGSLLYQNVNIIPSKVVREAKDLKFISRILSDGSGLKKVPKDFKGDFCGPYHLTRLSITEDTYLATGFHSYVVKLKEASHETA